MSHSNEPKHDELRDRLIDQALGEVLGGQAPPDLSSKILAAAQKQISVSPQQKERVMGKSKWGYVWLVVAACLLVVAGIVLMNTSGPQLALEQRDQPEQTEAPQAAQRSDDAGAEMAEDEPEGEPADYAATAETPSEEAAEPKPDVSREHNRPIQELLSQTKPLTLSDPVAAPPTARPPSRPDPSAVLGKKLDRFDSADGELWGSSPNGVGPGKGGDKYDSLVENPFRAVKDHPLSTFSIDVDTASYANVRRFLLREGSLPPPDAVRIEELVNYFDYDYEGPDGDVPFAAEIEAAGCPWKPEHRLVRVGLKGKEIQNEQRPDSNLVFLLDVSGSMNSPDKLPLLKEGMKLLAEQMRENDRVAIAVYASAEGLALPSTPGSERAEIITALDNLQAGGSTAGGAGIELAYRVAQENFIEGGVNRVLLCTDGDFNVGTTSTGDLVRMVEERAKKGVFLSVLGFGRGNLNDAMMETISNKGNGNYAYIDGITEAHKVLVEQMGGTLVTIAKDVKIQIEFNPARVAAFRLIGYENRMLAAEDFNDDKKDAGEIGAGHTVTALYEVVPTGVEVDVPNVDPLKYQTPSRRNEDEATSDELLTLKLRYKEPDADTSKLLEFPLIDAGARFGQASNDFQFAAAVGSFGMLLRGSEHKGAATYDAVLEIATSTKGPDVHGYRAELLEMVRRAKTLAER